uniref:Uncharacterized protein n=1 Tax=Cacopsylla melanoneura TaxID=428564 RepID=A0A8D8YNR3_9HEMI
MRAVSTRICRSATIRPRPSSSIPALWLRRPPCLWPRTSITFCSNMRPILNCGHWAPLNLPLRPPPPPGYNPWHLYLNWYSDCRVGTMFPLEQAWCRMMASG